MSGMKYVNRLRNTDLYSIYGRFFRHDLMMLRKNFHSEVILGLESMFEVARDVGTRGHTLEFAILMWRSEVRIRSFWLELFLC